MYFLISLFKPSVKKSKYGIFGKFFIWDYYNYEKCFAQTALKHNWVFQGNITSCKEE